MNNITLKELMIVNALSGCIIVEKQISTSNLNVDAAFRVESYVNEVIKRCNLNGDKKIDINPHIRKSHVTGPF